jgi:hypothetical protein
MTPDLTLLADGCPSCLTRGTEPFRVSHEPWGSVHCWYHCGLCGRIWQAWWDATSAEVRLLGVGT